MSSIIKHGRVIRKSQNLRGLMDYARVSRVVGVDTSTPCFLRVHYADGAEGIARFACHNVMLAWVAARRRWNTEGTARHA